jgi:acetyl/propionyl-CoA carboxylase alpha subunit
MSLLGKIADLQIEWVKAPAGSRGESQVRIAGGAATSVSWIRDKEGLWIETPSGLFGFDILAEVGDDGSTSYQVRRRILGGEWSGLSFKRAGEELAATAAGGVKKNVRVRAQMPGKIIRVSVKVGDQVEKGQSLLVMEAMKMENEIRASQAGRVSAVKVTEGQAVETGADLCLMDPV